MIRRMSIAILAVAALAGCATGYGYRGGPGDYYYGGGGGYDYYDYGPSYYGYGGYGHGYGSPYRYYGGYGGYSYYNYPYYGYPYYPRPPGHDHGGGSDHVDRSQRRHPYPGLPDKSGVDRGTLSAGPGAGDAAASRVRDPRTLRSGGQLRQSAPAARQSIGRPVRSLPPPRSNPGRSAPAPRPAPVRSESPRRSAPVPLRSAPSPRVSSPALRAGGRRAVPR